MTNQEEQKHIILPFFRRSCQTFQEDTSRISTVMNQLTKEERLEVLSDLVAIKELIEVLVSTSN